MEKTNDQLTIKYSQNKLKNKALIETLINQSSISPGDIVYDIGAGAGIISQVLLKKGARVIAVEKDITFYDKWHLQQQFTGCQNFELYIDDFLQIKLPLTIKYKVFSNIPFFHTADIIHKLLDNNNPPEDCYLIVQKEAGEKYTGIPRETLASLLLKPIYWLDIIHYFESKDFYPAPGVDIVLLQIEQRKFRSIPTNLYSAYKDLVVFLWKDSSEPINRSLKHIFTYPQQKRLCKLLKIDEQMSPCNLNFHQYLGLFQFFIRHRRQNLYSITGAEQNLRKQQNNLSKIHRTRVIKNR
jgi:23S rRNA (adenine-N6)-dimethyltransferase